MITPKGQAKVLFFGLARLIGPADVTQTALETGGVMGTPLYMPPEQARGQKADVRSNLWSLGVTYYESLTGVEPFRRPTTLAVLRAITDGTVWPMRELCPQTPLLAGQIVARALEKDPELRYQNARDLVTDLRGMLWDLEPGRVTGSVTHAELIRGAGVGARPIRLIVFLAAALMVAGTILLWFHLSPATGNLESTQISFSNEEKLGSDGQASIHWRWTGRRMPRKLRSPDGRRFLFHSDREGRGNVYELEKPRWFEFWKKPGAIRLTGNQMNITDATSARDSKSLYVLGRVEAGAMQVFDPRAGKLVPFLGGLPTRG